MGDRFQICPPFPGAPFCFPRVRLRSAGKFVRTEAAIGLYRFFRFIRLIRIPEVHKSPTSTKNHDYN